MPSAEPSSKAPADSVGSALPKVSIVILNWNSVEVTRACLESLRKSDYPAAEVIVVDNGSSDSSPDQIACEFPEVRLIRNATNLGFAGGLNVGLCDALQRGSDYLLALNNDTVVAPGFVGEMVRAAEQEPCIGLVSPKILFYEPSDRIWCAGGIYHRGWSFPKSLGVHRSDNGSYNRPKEISFATGCALLIKAAVVRRIGLFDESFFYLFEDLDFCYRARQAGFTAVYTPAAVVWHKDSYVAKKHGGKPFRDFYAARNAVLFARKVLRPWHWPVFLVTFGGWLAYRTTGYLLVRQWERVEALYRGSWNGFTMPLKSG